MSEPASKPEEHGRPPGHPADKPWPPRLREYPQDHPACRDEESKEAFNEGWARKDFGKEFVDGLIERHTVDGKQTFAGDWWMLAMLMRCAEVAKYIDPTGINVQRLQFWNETRNIKSVASISCHLERAILAGANLARCDLSRVHLEGAILLNANLEHADLNHTRLERAFLAHAKLKHADLSLARMSHAVLYDSNMEHANIQLAILDNANVNYAHLVGTQLNKTSLKYAELRYARLKHAVLTEAVLIGADVRGATDLRFDANRARVISIEGNAPDPWSVLRRTYTGPMFFVHFGLLLAFVLPYVGKVLALTAADHAGRMLGQATDRLPHSVPIVVEQVGAWKVLIGLDKGWWVPMLGAVLLVYNGLRGLLTIKVGQLRDAEERSGITPTLFEYMGTQRLEDEGRGVFAWKLVKEFILWVWRVLRAWVVRDGAEPGADIEAVGIWRVHRLLRVLFFIAIGSFAIHGVLWVMTTTLPKVRVVSQGDAPPPLVQPTD